MALIGDSKLIGSRRPDGIVIHETNYENMSARGFYVVVTPVNASILYRARNDKHGSSQADSWGSDAELLAFHTNLPDFFLCLLLPLALLADGFAEGGDNLVACTVLECY